MIRKLLAIHRNLFLDVIDSEYEPFSISSINSEYSLILGHKKTDVYPTLKDIINNYIESEEINKSIPLCSRPTISNELRLIMLILFSEGFVQMHLRKITMASYLALEPSRFSKLFRLNWAEYKSSEIFQAWKIYFENVFRNANSPLIVNDPNINNYGYIISLQKTKSLQKLQTQLPLNIQHEIPKDDDQSMDILNNNKMNTSELISVLKDIKASQQVIMSTLLEINKKLK